MNKFDPQLMKGIYPTLVLKLLLRNSEMYGYQIEKNIRILSNSSLMITEGSLYPILHKLEEKGYIKSKVKQVKNRQRKYYSITRKGMKEYETKEAEIFSIYDHVFNFLSN
jgi:DNA-binding PadR family transcriptional regulator